MDTGDLRKLAVDELTQKLRETRMGLFNAKVKHATGQLENTAGMGVLRRDIARMETVLGEMRGATGE